MLRETCQGLEAGGSRCRRGGLASVRAARRAPAPGPGEDQRPPCAREGGRGGAARGHRFVAGRRESCGRGPAAARDGRGAEVRAVRRRRLALPPAPASRRCRAPPRAREQASLSPARVGVLGPAPPGGWSPGGRSRLEALRGDEPAFSTWQPRGGRAGGRSCLPPRPAPGAPPAGRDPACPRPRWRENDSAARWCLRSPRALN